MSLRKDLERLPDSCWQNEFVRISPIKTEKELVYAVFECQLTDEQRELVNPAGFSISRAYLFREDNYPCIIYDKDGEAVGFINLCKWLGSGDAYSWSYFIDKEHQGMGYGSQTAQLAVAILKAAAPNKSTKLAVEAFNVKAQRLYESIGFNKLSEMDGDDMVFGI